MESAPKSTRRQNLREVTPYIVLTVGLLFTFIVSYRLAKVGEAEDRARFEVLVQDLHARIESRLESYTAVLRAGAGLFSANDSVKESEFSTFVKMLGLAEHYPGVQGMGFSLKLKPEERAALITARQRDGVAGFHLWPESERAEYHAVIYLEPQEPRNRAGLGFDMSTIPTRREPMERARDSGLPAATGRVTLFQIVDPQAQQPGFIIYVPVYRENPRPSNETERRAALLGFVFSAFRAADFFHGITSSADYEEIEFTIYDGAELAPDTGLHRSA